MRKWFNRRICISGEIGEKGRSWAEKVWKKGEFQGKDPRCKPQGPKPRYFSATYGTTEVVP
jgi:hypothetical protein